MHKPRIDTETAIDWARRVVLQSDRAWLPNGKMTDAEIQEYNIAHGIVVDGIYQDRDADAEPRPWWAFWRAQ
jgi:hypothetical protein